jgi:hypothetical protein
MTAQRIDVLATQAAALKLMRRRFDERLALLHLVEAANRLRAVMAGPGRLEGRLNTRLGR